MDLVAKLLMALEECPADDDEINGCLDTFENNNAGVSFTSGETRYAVLFEGLDYVLKIPRYGYCNEDYCQAEIRAYESAVKYRVEKLLLPVELLHITTSGIAIYKQPRYSFSTSDGSYHKDYDTYLDRKHAPRRAGIIDKVRHNCYDGGRIGHYWIARVIQLYGKKFCRSFEAWTKENHINDLHNSNTGWLNDKPIILDYAGYRG